MIFLMQFKQKILFYNIFMIHNVIIVNLKQNTSKKLLEEIN
jgi:hypothetical protein